MDFLILTKLLLKKGRRKTSAGKYIFPTFFGSRLELALKRR